MLRKITSFLLLFSLIVMVISSGAEFISPFGRLSMMIKWEMLGLDKTRWQTLHIIFMVVFTLTGLFYIYLNIKPIKAYLKNRSRKMVIFTKEMSIALLITAGLFYGTVQKFEPLEKFVKLNKSFNDHWVEEFKKERLEKMTKTRRAKSNS